LFEISRRGLIVSLAALPLAGCQSGEKANVRYRVVASFEVDGRAYEATTVMEIRYARLTTSLVGAGYPSEVAFDYLHCRRVPMEMPNAMSL